jgi:hypothetical protein
VARKEARGRGHWVAGSRQLAFAILCLALVACCPVLVAQAPSEPPDQEPATTSVPPSRIDPQAQELLDKTIQALGGQAFLQAKTVKMRGRIFAISEGVTAGFAPFESIAEFPDKRRFSYGKSKPVILINDGERGWQIDRYGLILQPAEQLRRWHIATRYGYENLLRKLIREPGLLAQSAGTDFVENLPAKVVDITDSQQAHVKLFVHAVNYLPIRLTYRLLDAQTHEWDDYEEVYGDYREFQGIQTPMHVTRLRDGERYSEVFRNAVEYNIEVPANCFGPGGGG